MTTLLQQPEALSRAAEAVGGLTELSWGPLALAAVATGFGLMLWLFGGRFMKGATTLAFVVGGGVAGYALTPQISPGVSPWIGLGAGVVLGFVLGSLMYRPAMAAALAIMLGVSAPTIIAVARNMHTPVVERSAESGRALLERSLHRSYGTENLAEPSGEPEPDGATAILSQAADFAEQLFSEASAQWEQMPIAHKSVLFLAAIGATALGFGIGLVAPRFAASGVTAGFGAALWLSAGAAVAHLTGASFESRLPDRAISWLLIWLGVTAIGAVFQWLPTRKPKESTAKPSGSAPASRDSSRKSK